MQISVLQQALLSIFARKGLPGNPFPIVAALLENNQTAEGIRLPEVLHSYCGFAQIG